MCDLTVRNRINANWAFAEIRVVGYLGSGREGHPQKEVVKLNDEVKAKTRVDLTWLIFVPIHCAEALPNCTADRAEA